MYVFSHREAILREEETPHPGFITRGHCFDGRSRKNTKVPPRQVYKEKQRKRLAINSKKTDFMVLSKRKKNSLRKHDLRLGDVNIKKQQNFKYLGRILTEHKSCNSKTCKRVGIVKIPPPPN